MKIKNLVPALFMLLYYVDANAQADQYVKLELKKGKTFVVGPDNILIVDTLIMHDKSMIQFDPNKEGTLIVRAAYIGENAIVTARGKNGKNSAGGLVATNGGNGGHLAVNINFIKLGSLIIDSRGGNGGNGSVVKRNSGKKSSNSVFERPGYSLVPIGVSNSGGISRTVFAKLRSTNTFNPLSTESSLNGIGGNGGNITLKYTTSELLVTIQKNQNNSIAKNKLILLSRAGKPGKGYSKVTTPHFNGQDGHIDVATAYD